MPDIVRDPIWQFIQTIVAVASIIMSVILANRLSNRKALVYERILTQLPNIEHETRGKSHVVSGEQAVSDVSKIVIKVTNSGNVPIPSSDFELPLDFDFGQRTQLLDAKVSETSPLALQRDVKVTVEETRVKLSPCLLNQKDSVTLTIFASQFSGQIVPGGRIVGVGEIREASKDRDATYETTVAGLVATFGFILLIRLLNAPSLLHLLENALALILDTFSGLVSDWIVKPSQSDPSFSAGFFRGFVTAGVVGFLARQLAFYWGKIQDLFAPTKEPVTKDGPSKYGKAVSTRKEFSRAATVVVLLVLMVFCLLVVVFRAIFPS